MNTLFLIFLSASLFLSIPSNRAVSACYFMGLAVYMAISDEGFNYYLMQIAIDLAVFSGVYKYAKSDKYKLVLFLLLCNILLHIADGVRVEFINYSSDNLSNLYNGFVTWSYSMQVVIIFSSAIKDRLIYGCRRSKVEGRNNEPFKRFSAFS